MSTGPLLDLLRQRSAARGSLRFDEFMDTVLFAPEIGYYSQKRQRVGFKAATDFYTATSAGPLFGELVVAACTKLLAGQDLSTFTFVEIGAEPDPVNPDFPAGILNGVKHPFGHTRTLRLGDDLTLAGRLVVFSNELFDAQPCRRFRFRQGTWVELGVVVSETGVSETELSAFEAPSVLPAAAVEGYTLDLPLAAASLTSSLAAQPWSGLFLAFDYGKGWEELSQHTPQGTVRAYLRHKQSNDLYSNLGEQDLTCHVCWDWLSHRLAEQGFTTPSVQSQESFFIHHSGEWIAKTMAEEATRMSQRKMALMQLLHPANMGQKFQVLHAVRSSSVA